MAVDNFRRSYFPGVPDGDWRDWRWQLRNRLAAPEDFERVLGLTDDEREAFRRGPRLPVGVTPYYAALVAGSGSRAALRRTILPSTAEWVIRTGEVEDPLGEREHEAVPGLIHTYPDRVLVFVSGQCGTYCRYCTRGRMVGRPGSELGSERWAAILEYIREQSGVREVILSGGDPLVLSSGRLERLLNDLRAIGHVEVIRVSTRMPVVLPQRVTDELVEVLGRHQPLWLSLHCVHPDELTVEVGQACERLVRAGIPLLAQMVLLAGVNDGADIIKRLVHGLVKMRVHPYYLHQCDQMAGTGHFRTPLQRSVEIMGSLYGHTSGYCVPLLMIDPPGGGGKVPLAADYLEGREGEDWLVRDYLGRTRRYRENVEG